MDASGLRGVYILVLRLLEGVHVAVGGLGIHRLDPGLYMYVGKGYGRGSSSVEGRLGRHLSKDKKPFWHIDYLTLNPKFKAEAALYASTAELSECRLARMLIEELGAGLAVEGFGSSDCGCKGHLIHAPKASLEGLIEAIHSIFSKLKLKPVEVRVEIAGDEAVRDGNGLEG
ncbi:MAG: GIY-YIG nuclease family protein [Candidatus Bathyarchaeia archaeon]